MVSVSVYPGKRSINGHTVPCLITTTPQDMLKMLVMILISIIIIDVNTNNVDGTKEMKTSQSKYYLIKTKDTKV